MFARLLLLLCLCCIACNSFCQDSEIFTPDSIRKEIAAVQINTSLHIDGLLLEPEWKLTKASPRFIQVEPYQGSRPQQETEVKVLYNRQYLYFGIIAHDSLGKKAIRAMDFKRDFDYKAHDLLNIAFDCFNDKRNAMSFATNAYGVQRDLLSFDDLYYDEDWNGLWKVRTNRTDSGWTAEIAIPWQTLRYPKKTDSVQQWGLSIYRNRRLTNEISSFSPFPRVFSSLRMNYAGLLTNLKPPPPKTNIRFQPYVLSSFDHFRGFDSTVKVHNASVKFGGDIKWALNSNSVLDLTANTDFAQADADQQVNNVSQFSVFFPEKRQFFLENASLFGVGIAPIPDGSGGMMRVQPFFSRSIGLDSAGTPIPIDLGGRFVYRSLKTNYGAILMRQHASDNTPATNFFVGRFSENLGKGSRVGGLVTVKDNSAGRNTVSTIDGFFRLGDSHSLNVLVMNSSNNHGGKNGIAGFAQYFYITNHMKVWWTQTLVTRDFDPQMGFVSRKDVIGTTPGINWFYRGRLLPFKKIIRAFEPGIQPEFYWNASKGTFIERTIPFFPIWLNFQNGAYLGYAIMNSYQHLLQPFQPLGINILPGEYHYTHQEIWLSTDPSRILNLVGIGTWGQYYNGKLHSADWKLQFAPIPHISITARFNRNRFTGVGELATTATVDLYGIEGRFALNPRLQLTGFYQKNAANNLENYNLRISWEYQPLSYIYLVLNHSGFTNLLAKTQLEDHIIAKISYLKQL